VKILRRIVIGLGIVITLMIVFIFWIFPTGLSLWTVWKTPKWARVAPVELKDLSISQAAGSRLQYFSYDFEVPWSDIGAARQVSPNRAVVDFRSGLQVSVTAVPAKEFVNMIASEWFKVPPEVFEAKVGDAARSDYEFLRRLYALTPQKMNLWAASPDVHYRESLLLHIKSVTLLPWAQSGIFNVHNQEYRGFQQGSCQARSANIVVDLYSDGGAVEFTFDQRKYQSSPGVSQAEINRVIQSLRKAQETPSVVPAKTRRVAHICFSYRGQPKVRVAQVCALKAMASSTT
jgi:hypothetical protein